MASNISANNIDLKLNNKNNSNQSLNCNHFDSEDNCHTKQGNSFGDNSLEITNNLNNNNDLKCKSTSKHF